MTLLKICGLSTTDAVDAALAGGATHLGFVFFPKSPRRVDAIQAAALAERARGRAQVVAVTVDPDDALLTELALILRPDLVQLHGAETPGRVAQVKTLTRARAIKALPVRQPSDLDRAADYAAVADHLMFDAQAPEGADLPGGVGARFDWTILSGRRFERPWFLAGGLDPANVAEALAVTRAPGLDVSSGVESAPGVKDPALIAAFLKAAQAASPRRETSP